MRGILSYLRPQPAMLAELLGGVVADYLLNRTRNLQIARSRLIVVSWILAAMGLVLAIFVHDLVIGLVGFTVALFFPVRLLGRAAAVPLS